MKFNIENGTNFISIGYSNIGAYLKIKKPVSLIWADCGGSIAQYLCMMPCSEVTREKLHTSITNSLYEDFTGRIEELYQALQPLFTLFENGEYVLGYHNGSKLPVTIADPDNVAKIEERWWFPEYPEVVDLGRITELKHNYKEDRRIRGLESYREDLVGFTSTWIYDTMESGRYIATRPLSEINSVRITFFEKKIAAGERPFVILTNAFYTPAYEYSSDFILDGHHKLQAYKNLGIDPPYVTITRNFYKANEPEFDLESLAEQLYPWQMRHILDHWDKEDGDIAELLKKPSSPLHRFIKNGQIKEYHDNKNIKSDAFYINDIVEGKLLEWYDNGQLKRKIYYNNGKKTGIWKEWFSSGQLKSTHGYDHNGDLHGKSAAYFENGKQRSESLFENGKHTDGYGYSRWGHTQNMEFEFWYENNSIVKKKSYSDNGRLIRMECYHKKQGKMVSLPITMAHYYEEPVMSSSGTPEKNLNIIRERQYPETGHTGSWRIFVLVLFMLLQLMRMCH